ncbi:MAG: hypothetical protein C0496_11330 [Erythrobacter sp.]|nr:hypothetical protein [Erythrobacter sp.]MBA4766218.1 hypothetical protein [Porphyrobacter sp.]
MKTHEQLRELRHYGPDRMRGTTFAVDAKLADELPALSLPTMSQAAREAFRAVLAYEAPPANGSVRDTLALIEARGYTVHSCDWIPDFRWFYAGDHPAIYQPWSDYLSERGFTRFHRGNTLTPDNCRHFAPRERAGAFKELVLRDDPHRLACAKAILVSQPAGLRAKLLNEVHARGAFDGLYPWQVRFIREFLDDKAANVRNTAKALLDRGSGRVSEKAYAEVIANHLMVSEDIVTFRQPPESHTFLFTEFLCTSFVSLAETLGLSPQQLAERADITGLGPNFMQLANNSDSHDVWHILARRALDQGIGAESLYIGWFRDADPDLWRRGLEATKASPYVNRVQEFLGEKTGTMSAAEMLAWREFETMRLSVIREKEEGKLPVNIQYDPLRYLGKVVDKEAAQIILDEATTLGMSPDNPRLTMVKLNLAL